jgi:hypothetical protein
VNDDAARARRAIAGAMLCQMGLGLGRLRVRGVVHAPAATGTGDGRDRRG